MRPLVASLILCLLVESAAARPSYLQAVGRHFGPALPTHLNRCRLCHVRDRPEHDNDPEAEAHNAFGKRLASVKTELRKAEKKRGILERLHAIANEDCDGDGVPNLVEILTGHAPGNAADRPSAVEAAAGQRKAADWLASLPTYPWEPFEPVHRPAVPITARPEWVRNPIDAFLAEGYDRRGLTPRPPAHPVTLLRRIHLDLIGLPPTPAEMETFLADPSPAAYERLVDRLLNSPAYGERWGRHWMDVWRYSDWAGYADIEIRDSQPHIWRWRDWIIDSLNTDKGYDRMIVEMLAADEVAPDDLAALRAVGFLVRNWYRSDRNVWLDRIVEHTGKAFLAVTMNCARCHDHFFDPIKQEEYYAFRAIFEPHDVRTDRVPGEVDVKKDGLVRVYDARPAAPTYLFERGDHKRPDQSRKLSPGVPGALQGGPLRPQPVQLPPAALFPDQRDFAIEDDHHALRAAVQTTQQAAGAARSPVSAGAAGFVAALCGMSFPTGLAAAVHRAETQLLEWRLAQTAAERAAARLTAFEAALNAARLKRAGTSDMAEAKGAAQAVQKAERRHAVLEAQEMLLTAQSTLRTATAIQARVVAMKRLAFAEKSLARATAEVDKPLNSTYGSRSRFPAQSTGRRLALARWIAARDNPLTARVAVNHIWLRHFGQALVPSVFDFGNNGRPPSHPALLDWLAAEFMETGWSMKHLHRLMVTSRVYQMQSTDDPANAALDPDNRLLWKMNLRRMEAEAVRDAVLFVAGRLDRTFSGPDLNHEKGLTVFRRSLYFRHAAEKQMTFLQLFDGANVDECYQRNETIVPQQALAMTNSPLLLDMSRILGEELTRAAGPPGSRFADAAFIQAAFKRILNRPSTAAEVSACSEFLVEQSRRLSDPTKLTALGGPVKASQPPSDDPGVRARQNLVHVLLNHNDFVSIR